MTLQKRRGGLGEKIAYGWLKKNGFNVILKNYCSKYGEIDLIAIKFDSIFFIEVKLRNHNCAYAPKEAVDVCKQRKIIKTAIVFLNKHDVKLQPRFSVIEILHQQSGEFVVNFLNDAFEVKGEYELFCE